MQIITQTSPITTTMSEITKIFYMWPLGRAKAFLDKQLIEYSLLYNGSEVVVVPQSGHDRLEIPIDTTMTGVLQIQM